MCELRQKDKPTEMRKDTKTVYFSKEKEEKLHEDGLALLLSEEGNNNTTRARDPNSPEDFEERQTCMRGQHHNNNNNNNNNNNAFKSAIQDFSQSPVSNPYPQTDSAQQWANHMQHIKQLSRATAQILSLTEFKSHLL